MYVQGATGADARAPLHALSLRSELLGRSLTLSDIHADTPCLVGTLSATEALVGTEKKAPDYRVAALCRTGLPAAAGLAESPGAAAHRCAGWVFSHFARGPTYRLQL